MKRRAAALLLCVLLVTGLSATPAEAAKNVYFTAINDNILALSDETMPFWSGGFLYIPSSIFTRDVRRDIGIGYIYPAANDQLVLYGFGQSLQCDLSKAYIQSTSGALYYPAAVMRGGVPFVPASVVAEFFGLTYSVTEVPNGYMVWLRDGSNTLPEGVFADAAARRMADRYDQYTRSKEPAAPVVTPEEPDASETTFDGKSVYLCLKAAEGSLVSAQLDALDSRSTQAAFFCTVDFLEQQGDLLRRMIATGQSVGILLDGEDPDRTPEEQAEAGNRALEAATCGRSRLVALENGADTAQSALEQAGYCCLTPNLDRSGYDLRSAAQAEALLQRVSARRGSVSMWLGDRAASTGLRAFLTAAAGAEDRCLALPETAA